MHVDFITCDPVVWSFERKREGMWTIQVQNYLHCGSTVLDVYPYLLMFNSEAGKENLKKPSNILLSIVIPAYNEVSVISYEYLKG